MGWRHNSLVNHLLPIFHVILFVEMFLLVFVLLVDVPVVDVLVDVLVDTFLVDTFLILRLEVAAFVVPLHVERRVGRPKDVVLAIR